MLKPGVIKRDLTAEANYSTVPAHVLYLKITQNVNFYKKSLWRSYKNGA